MIGIILAAGYGKRMNSPIPKVLHKVNGLEILARIVQQFHCVEKILVVVNQDNYRPIRDCIGDEVTYVIQENPCGTGDAVRCALETLVYDGQIIISCGDVPLLHHDILYNLIGRVGFNNDKFGLVVYEKDDPTGYGRVYWDEETNRIQITEDKDCDDYLRRIQLVNGGLYMFPCESLRRSLQHIQPRNAQNEYYLTDVVPLLQEDTACVLYTLPKELSFMMEGINTVDQWSRINNIFTAPVQSWNDVALSSTQITHLLSTLTVAKDSERIEIRRSEISHMHPMIQVYVIYHELPGLIAMGTLLLEPKLIHDCGIVGHIEDVVVSPFFRREGFGKRIVQHLIQEAKNAGCYKVILNAKQENQEFYTKLGFASCQLQFEMRL